MLRMLIHNVADIHQPLHAATYYGLDFPYGDQGGNLWDIDYSNNIRNLH